MRAAARSRLPVELRAACGAVTVRANRTGTHRFVRTCANPGDRETDGDARARHARCVERGRKKQRDANRRARHIGHDPTPSAPAGPGEWVTTCAKCTMTRSRHADRGRCLPATAWCATTSGELSPGDVPVDIVWRVAALAAPDPTPQATPPPGSAGTPQTRRSASPRDTS